MVAIEAGPVVAASLGLAKHHGALYVHDWRVWRADRPEHALNEPKVPLRSWRSCGALRLDGLKFGSSGHPEIECKLGAR